MHHSHSCTYSTYLIPFTSALVCYNAYRHPHVIFHCSPHLSLNPISFLTNFPFSIPQFLTSYDCRGCSVSKPHSLQNFSDYTDLHPIPCRTFVPWHLAEFGFLYLAISFTSRK